MAKKVNIQLPKALLDFPEEDRAHILTMLREALALPETKVLPRTTSEEHNMWERNQDHLLAEAEDAFYMYFAEAEAMSFTRLMHDLGLPDVPDADIQKAFSDDFEAWETDILEKAKGKRGKLIDVIKQQRARLEALVNRTKDKRQQFTDWISQKGTFTRKQLEDIDTLLKQAMPNVEKTAEDLAVRAFFIGKIRNQAERENFETLGAYIDRFPQSIQTAKKEGVVLTLREKEKAKAKGKTVNVLPLTEQEVAGAHMASLHAGDKMTDITNRHRAGVRQLVMQGIKERWSSEVLARKLYDKFGDHNRDWRRVAITELSFAVNDAYLGNLEEGERVIGMGSVNACKHCKGYVIGKEFTVTHKVPAHETYETDMKQVWAGKTNVGRRVQEYVPCIPMHPNCRCRYHRLSPFYTADSTGTLKRKTTAELIQEERAKRGMAPDPNIEAQLASIRKQLDQS